MDAKPKQLEFTLFEDDDEGEWSLSEFVEMIQKAASEKGGGEVRLKYAERDWGEGGALRVWLVRDETPKELADRIAAEQTAHAEWVAKYHAQIAHQQAVEWQTYLRLKAKFEGFA